MVASFNRLQGIMRTVYNQCDSMVRPLHRWLDERGVKCELNTRVPISSCAIRAAEKIGEHIVCEGGGNSGVITIGANDYVLVTLGSMTEGSSLGVMDLVPVLNGKANGGAWTRWEKIALGRPEFGRPSAFANHIGESK